MTDALTASALIAAALLLASCANDYTREAPGASGGRRVTLINRCQSEARAAGSSAHICSCVVDRYLASYGSGTSQRPSSAWLGQTRRQCGG